jgi:hypothetical protein
MAQLKKLPIGIQTFEKIRTNGTPNPPQPHHLAPRERRK